MVRILVLKRLYNLSDEQMEYLWLRQVLRALPTATTVEHFEALLPWNLKVEQLITA